MAKVYVMVLVRLLKERASLQAVTENQILTISYMFQWAKDHISGIEFFFVYQASVQEHFEKFKLVDCFAKCKTIW